ncbi:hypothetical protein QFC22_002144 [Naganishia vaughanmartiniae]|uniref:Uncharacterized protein n=1 Tax=Naganishia vaughanmartiniae TaxID=1424756 RepID=A0ACC2XEQ8_9TREE|nr:hypothetical protein QFC22_002144 [Naganishia vaughanmartiniae]
MRYDDIAMPEGPPPDTAETQEDSDSDDSIVMPEGTPPPEARIYAPAPVNQPVVMMPALPPIGMPFNPGFPQYMPPMYAPPGAGNFAPPMSYAQGQYQARPYAQGNAFMPPPPPPPRGFFPGQAGPGPVRPPRDSGWSFRPPPSTANLPVRPGGIMNDPLSGVPHQTFQAHRQARREEAQDVALAAAATTTIEGKNTTTVVPPPASAEISAAPQMRDLRKEAAVFVPRAMKKKKPATLAGNAQVITAAPVVSSAPENGGVNESRAASGMAGDGNQHAAPISAPTYNPAAAGGGLLSKLSGVLGTPATAPAKKEKEDDYKAFLAGLDSLEQ